MKLLPQHAAVYPNSVLARIDQNMMTYCLTFEQYLLAKKNKAGVPSRNLIELSCS